MNFFLVIYNFFIVVFFLIWMQLNSGKVVAVGPGLLDKAGNTIPVAVKEGDTVLLPDYGGTQVKLGEKE